MWRRWYLLSVLVRLYFALRPSYIHPDEHFQGPEIIAGEVFGYPIYKTWEFTSSHPIRSIFPFWLIYGWPLTVLKWLWEGLGYGDVPPIVAFYTLRVLMFLLSFVLGDWAIHELVPAANERRMAITLVASSYVTWTYQMHTFSNSIEALLVLWCIVLIFRLRDNKQETQASASAALAFLGVLGAFNRITFPAFILLPLAQITPSMFRKPLRILVMAVVGLMTMAVAVTMDTEFYTGQRPQLRSIHKDAVFTPLNNLLHNMVEENLAQHGLHPFWQHFVANLPQLIGPAFPLIFIATKNNTLFWSAIIGTSVLSCFPHQEARFLMPTIPLILSSIKVPKPGIRVWAGIWIVFNVSASILFGLYHQGGVVPAQAWISQQENISQALWWKTYSPPRWLLDGKNLDMTTTDLMGMPGLQMIYQLHQDATCASSTNKTLLVAPYSAIFLDSYTGVTGSMEGLSFTELWRDRRHIGLDDLDFGDDGVWPTLQRVIGRRGLVMWHVSRDC